MKKVTDTQLVITGIFILGIVAACFEQWNVVGECIVGGFALLKIIEKPANTENQLTGKKLATDEPDTSGAPN